MPLSHASPESITAQLRTLGVAPGSTVMVHASLSKLGPVLGRATGVLDGLLASIEPSGTLVMVLGADADEPFVAEETEVDIEDMGVLAEVFRNRDGVKVNDHAAARFAAIGPNAEALLKNPPLHHYHGHGSPLHRLTDLDGSILRLGADLDTVTLTHWAEYLAEIPNKRLVSRRYVRADIGEQWIDSLDDDDGIIDWPGGDYFGQILIDFIKAGHALQGPVGDCTADLFSAQKYVHFAVAWMEKNLTQ